ncbi:MAG: sensor domain-containing diguanylate cyclase [Plesiomonas sp.]
MEKRKPRAFWQVWRWTFFVFILLFFVDVSAFYELSRQNKIEQQRFFDTEAQAYVARVRVSINTDLQLLTSLSLGFRLNNYVPLRDIRAYIDSMQLSAPRTIKLQWFPRVKREQATPFLQQMRTIYPHYQYQRGLFGENTPLASVLAQSYIFPLAFVYPDTEQNQQYLGLLFGGKKHDSYLADIQEGAEQVITAPIQLWGQQIKNNNTKNGFLVINAVRNIQDKSLDGIFVSVINSYAYFSHVLETINPRPGMTLRISDELSVPEVILYQSMPAVHVSVPSGPPMQHVEYISQGDRQWKVTVTGHWALYAENRLLLKILWWGGLVVSLLVSLIVGYAVNRTGLYEFLLQQRTRELEFMLEHDHLTRVLNRRAYDRLLGEFCQSGQPFTLFMIDMDYFKRINDCFGHAAGDAALIEAALRLQQAAGSGTYLARIGGDEFALMTPETDSAAIQRLGEQMLDAVRAPTFSFRQQPIHLSITLGAAVYRHGQNPDQVQDCADQALYAAKLRGRGRCMQYVQYMNGCAE